MSPRFCCCRDCLIFSDDFNRADAASLGAGWDDFGNWDINIGRAITTAVATAICQTIHPVPDPSMYVEIDTIDEEEGDIYEVLVNVVDENNYHFARLERNGALDSVLSLGKVAGGAETITASATINSLIGTARTIGCHIADNEFCATASLCTESFVEADPTVFVDGYYSGMGGSDGIEIDAFRFYEHRKTNPLCTSCVCNCQGSYVPPRLNAHITGYDRMAGILDCDIVLEWDRTNVWWSGSATCCGVLWDLVLSCPDYNLMILGPECVVTSKPVNPNGPREPYLLQCHPFYELFGPYDVTGDLACVCGVVTAPDDYFLVGSYDITITEL